MAKKSKNGNGSSQERCEVCKKFAKDTMANDDGVLCCPSCIEEEKKGIDGATPDEVIIDDIFEEEEKEDQALNGVKAACEILASALKEEQMKKDAIELRKVKRKIMILSEEIKSRRDEIKGLSSKESLLSSKLSQAILDPQMYIDQVMQEQEEERMLNRGPDPRQITIEDPDLDVQKGETENEGSEDEEHIENGTDIEGSQEDPFGEGEGNTRNESSE